MLRLSLNWWSVICLLAKYLSSKIPPPPSWFVWLILSFFASIFSAKCTFSFDSCFVIPQRCDREGFVLPTLFLARGQNQRHRWRRNRRWEGKRKTWLSTWVKVQCIMVQSSLMSQHQSFTVPQAREWVSEASEQTNGRASGPVLLSWFLIVLDHREAEEEMILTAQAMAALNHSAVEESGLRNDDAECSFDLGEGLEEELGPWWCLWKSGKALKEKRSNAGFNDPD